MSAPAGFGKSTLSPSGWPSRRTTAPPHGSRSMRATIIRAVLGPRDRRAADGARDRDDVLALLIRRPVGRDDRRAAAQRARRPPGRRRAGARRLPRDRGPQVLRRGVPSVDHLPAHVHLVIATRVDPALPLARMRVRGDLVEIRAADLRFTPDEAVAYLDGVMGLALTASDTAALEARTEGWIAAIQLAGLSMQGRDDLSGFIAGFAGDDRYVVDYLVEEVLQRQPERVRTFLLETSILARMNGSLVDAVTGHVGGNAMLEALDRRQPVLVPFDDRRQWYRYHHLFGESCWRLLDERPASSTTCIGARATGSSRTVNGRRPSATLWPVATTLEPPTSSSSPCRRCASGARRTPCADGSTRCPGSSSCIDPCSALGTPGPAGDGGARRC